jgi:SAM-dependent methyltransferase
VDDVREHYAKTFDRAAELYERARPSYASGAIDWIVPAGVTRVLDLGAGTGKVTERLVGRGYEVVAVDPSPNMLAQLRAKLPEVEVHVGTAEATGLADGSVDAVLVGSAFHWFRRPDADHEIARVLRPHGRVGILGNSREPDSLTARLLARAAAHGGIDRDHPARRDRDQQLDPALFTSLEQAGFPYTQTVTPDQVVELVASRSYVIDLPDAERATLLGEVRRLVDTDPDVGGRAEFELSYVTRARRCERRA